MVAPNVQEVVNGTLIVVTLVQGKAKASFVLRSAGGKTAHPRIVSIEHYLKAGMSEHGALRNVLGIAKGVLESAGGAGLF
jgi:hypothetical protein